MRTNVLGTFSLLESVRAYWSALDDAARPGSASCT
jgi:dTDP-D-glucose 4,6-dehydratase